MKGHAKKRVARKTVKAKRIVRKAKRAVSIVRTAAEHLESRFLTHKERERLEKLGFHHHIALGERMSKEKIEKLLSLVRNMEKSAKHAWHDLSMIDERAIKIQLEHLKKMR